MPSNKPSEWGVAADDTVEDDEDAEGEADEEVGDQEDEAAAPDGDDAEEAQEVEEVEPADEEPAPRPRPSKSRPKAARAGRPQPKQPHRTGRMIWALVLAVIIIVPLAGVIFFYYGPAGDVQRIDVIAQPYTDKTGSGMFLAATVDTGKPSSLSGKADVTTSFNGSNTYTGTIDISDSQGTKSIPFKDFCVGNGDYRVDVKFMGKSSAATFKATGIIEKLTVNAFNITRKDNATMEPGTARMGVLVIFMSAAGQAQMPVTADSVDININGGGGFSKYTESVGAKTQLSTTYALPGNGNYTINTTFHNSKVKADSKYATISQLASDSNSNLPYIMVFIPPNANAGNDQTVQWKALDGGGKVTLDGSRSMAYGGATIVNYQWDYGDGTYETGMIVTHVFPQKNDNFAPYYDVILTVTDSNGSLSMDDVHIIVE